MDEGKRKEERKRNMVRGSMEIECYQERGGREKQIEQGRGEKRKEQEK